jgi:cob(I)alamin adenosyltransferase
MHDGKVQVYTGNGKGKTTASLGLCFRAAGQGLRPCVVQFWKRQRCGEHITAERLGIEMLQCQLADERQAALCQLQVARERMACCDVLVCDEILGVLHEGYLTLDEVLSLLDARPAAVELVLTGRNAPQQIIARADLVTEMRPIKHYFDETGLPARLGIEY